MSMALGPTLAAYIDASNAHDAETLLACFTADAVVIDEGQTHRGSDAIRQWIVKTAAAYAVTLEVTRIAEQGSEAILTCRVTGTFPGSPIDLRFFFTLERDRISALTIRA